MINDTVYQPRKTGRFAFMPGSTQRDKILEALFNASPVGILRMRQRSMERVNPAFCQMVGYTTHELEGRDARMLYLSEHEYRRVGEESSANMTVSNTAVVETRWLRKDGLVLDVCLQGRLLWPGRLQDGHIVNVRDITERKQTEARLKDYQDKLRRLAWEVTRMEVRERHCLAEALHDGLSQTLAMMRIALQSLLASPSCSCDCRQRAGELMELVDRALGQAREVTAELSPAILYDMGLEAGVARLAEQISRHYGLAARLKAEWKRQPRLDPEVAVALHRMIRELLMNAVKHGRPGSIEIGMSLVAGHCLRVTVRDDGLGFDPFLAETCGRHGFGLFSVRERVKALGGEFKISSWPGVGTTAAITLDLRDIAAWSDE